MSREGIEMRVIMEGAQADLKRIENALRERGVRSEIVRPPGGCGSG